MRERGRPGRTRRSPRSEDLSPLPPSGFHNFIKRRCGYFWGLVSEHDPYEEVDEQGPGDGDPHTELLQEAEAVSHGGLRRLGKPSSPSSAGPPKYGRHPKEGSSDLWLCFRAGGGKTSAEKTTFFCKGPPPSL